MRSSRAVSTTRAIRSSQVLRTTLVSFGRMSMLRRKRSDDGEQSVMDHYGFGFFLGRYMSLRAGKLGISYSEQIWGSYVNQGCFRALSTIQ
jgi:hypothetical protein